MLISTRLPRRRTGSALILVVALVVVLFVVGMGFLGMSQMDRAAGAIGLEDARLDVEANAVCEVVIGQLTRDLWGDDANMLGNGTSSHDVPDEPFDFPCTNSDPAKFGLWDDAWLASTLPEKQAGGVYLWPHITNLAGPNFNRGVAATDTSVLASALEADADGDGVNDSRWLLSPNGQYRWAVRVIDESAMINLNTAGRGTPFDLGNTPYSVDAPAASIEAVWSQYGNGAFKWMASNQSYGAYFGRSLSSQSDIGSAELVKHPDLDYSMQLDNARITDTFPNALPFRPWETFALQSYGVKPGPAAARLELDWPMTFTDRAATVGSYSYTRSADRRYLIPDISETVPLTNPFDAAHINNSLQMYFTSYSWVRNVHPNVMPTGGAPSGAASWDAWMAIYKAGLKTADDPGCLYVNNASPHNALYTKALVAAFALSGAMAPTGGLSSQQVEQAVVNLADWRDADQDLSTTGAGGGSNKVDTVYNTSGIYGNEPQVFITEVAIKHYALSTWSNSRYALELFNPYNVDVNVGYWQIRLGTLAVTIPGGTVVSAGGRLTIRSHATTAEGFGWPSVFIGTAITNGNLLFRNGDINRDIELLRPMLSNQASGAGNPLVIVDRAGNSAISAAMGVSQWLDRPSIGNVTRHASRGDKQWLQSRDVWYNTPTQSFGSQNAEVVTTFYTPYQDGRLASIAVPPDNVVHDFDTVGQLHYLMTVGPQAAGVSGCKAVTDHITAATTGAATGDLYLNWANATRGDYRVLGWLTRMSRRYNSADDNGDGTADDLTELRLPGLVNVNTAPPHVLMCMSYYMSPGMTWHGANGPDGNDEGMDIYQKLAQRKKAVSGFTYQLHQRIYDYRQNATNRGFQEGVGQLGLVNEMTSMKPLLDQLTYTGNSSYVAQSITQYNARLEQPDVARWSTATNRPVPTWYYDTQSSTWVNSSSTAWHCDQESPGSPTEQNFMMDRLTDVGTTRSDVFMVYVLVEDLDRSYTGNFWDPAAKGKFHRRLMVLLDRSKCNYAPGAAGYVRPQIIGRSVMTW
ncbi:MAG: hypothetical protein BIFFINMI_00825 [Phycisphaerae bacterium]|nr:hypothetical protein [Phycisphaerae bacterium]